MPNLLCLPFSLALHVGPSLHPPPLILITVWAVSASYLLVALLLKRPKPTTVVGTIIVFLVLYPATYLLALALHRVKTREGRIQLEREARAGDVEGIVVNHHDQEAQRGPPVVVAAAPPSE